MDTTSATTIPSFNPSKKMEVDELKIRTEALFDIYQGKCAGRAGQEHSSYKL